MGTPVVLVCSGMLDLSKFLMNILVVTPFYKPAYIYGGPVRSLPLLCEAIVAQGHHVTVFTTKANGSLSNLSDSLIAVENFHGVRVWFFNRDLPGNYYISRELAKACNRNMQSFDLVYVMANWVFPFIPACRSGLRQRKPLVISPRTSFMQKTWQGKWLKKYLYHWLVERKLIQQSSAIHFTTPLEEKESTWLGLKPPGFIVSNPVCFDEFNRLPGRGKFRETAKIPQNEKIVIFLGRLEPRKGLDIALEAFASVCQVNDRVRFIIAGPDKNDYSKTLHRLVNQYKIADKVNFTGYLPAEARLQALVDSDVFILTSISENFGMSVVEAISVGLPVLISDQVGVASFVEHSGCGYVVSLTRDSITNGLLHILDYDQNHNDNRDEILKIAEATYSPEMVAREMLDQFNRILSSS